MNLQNLAIKEIKALLQIVAACFLILLIGSNSLAQYKGAPVKKNRLVQALRSRQLQTQDIVTIINTNGVDFRLTPDVKKTLVAAGARPEVIKAISNNQRLLSKENETIAKAGNYKVARKNKPVSAPSYDDLLDQAIYSYQNQKNPRAAVRILEAAARSKPTNPEAYQMLGFVYLYGLNDLSQAEKLMRESFTNGGSAVFRVYHDDNGKFTKSCTGSLYISKDSMRFESDDNVHTFETTTVNVDKIKLDTETTRAWKNRSVFKVFLKIGNDKAKFRFAPLTGQSEESRMVGRFIAASNSNKNTNLSLVTPTH